MINLKARFFRLLTELHDYFKDHDVRNAHVFSINNEGDWAVSFFKEGWNYSLQCILRIG